MTKMDHSFIPHSTHGRHSSFYWCRYIPVNTLRPRINRCHFADDLFKCILLNKNVLISIRISLKHIAKVRPSDKPLYEPMMIISLTHICVTRPQWVKVGPKHRWWYRQYIKYAVLMDSSTDQGLCHESMTTICKLNVIKMIMNYVFVLYLFLCHITATVSRNGH